MTKGLSANEAMDDLCFPTRRRKLPFILTNVGDGRRSRNLIRNRPRMIQVMVIEGKQTSSSNGVEVIQSLQTRGIDV